PRSGSPIAANRTQAGGVLRSAAAGCAPRTNPSPDRIRQPRTSAMPAPSDIASALKSSKDDDLLRNPSGGARGGLRDLVRRSPNGPRSQSVIAPGAGGPDSASSPNAAADITGSGAD